MTKLASVLLFVGSLCSVLGETAGLAPLNTLGKGIYQGFSGGLYAEGRNEPHGSDAAALRAMSAAIQPLDRAGKPDAAGRIVVVGLGASVCKQIFDTLEAAGREAEGKRTEVVFVNCAKGGHDVNKISDPARGYWEAAKATVEKAGAAPAQVQVAWYQSDDLQDARDDFPGRPQRLQEAIARNMREARQHFPNLRICYHSARHTTALMPEKDAKAKHGEPRPYHVGWATKWLIEAQAAGKAELRFDGPGAPAPLVTWATYFWTSGDQPREDGYRWSREMNVPDGIHFSDAGRQRVAGELLTFWRTDPFAREWFGGPQPSAIAAPAKTLKPQQLAAQNLQPGEPALLINGKSKFAKLERLLGTDDPVRLVAWDMAGKQVLAINDVFHQRTELNQLLGSGEFRLHFLGKDGQRLKMSMDVPDVVQLK